MLYSTYKPLGALNAEMVAIPVPSNL